MFLEGLDQLDQKIILLLIQNARMSYSQIGQQTGISRVAVKARIRSLEQRGIISAPLPGGQKRDILILDDLIETNEYQ